jgi:hypothetical protein
VHQHVVHEARGLVVGGGVLVEEKERVHLADVEHQALARVGLHAVQRQRNVELVPGLGQQQVGVRGPRLGLEGGGVDGAGVARAQARATALAEAELGVDAAVGIAHAAAGQGHRDVATVVGARLALVAVAAGAVHALHHRSQAGTDRDALQRLDLARLLLHVQRHELDRLQPRHELGLFLAQALGGERGIGLLLRLLELLQPRVGAAAGLERGLELAVALLQPLHALHQLAEIGLGGRAVARGQRRCAQQRQRGGSDEAARRPWPLQPAHHGRRCHLSSRPSCRRRRR